MDGNTIWKINSPRSLGEPCHPFYLKRLSQLSADMVFGDEPAKALRVSQLP